MAGFVQGFLVTCAYFVADGSIEQESMFPDAGRRVAAGSGPAHQGRPR
jgi:hypothetical protein